MLNLGKYYKVKCWAADLEKRVFRSDVLEIRLNEEDR